MSVADRMHRHLRGVVADLVAEWGRVDVVHQRSEATPAEYDRYVSPFETYGAFGGAGIWVTNPDGEVLLVRREDEREWLDPGGGLEPGETYRECAVRECEEETGLTPTVTGIEQVRVFHVTDGTDRPPVPDVAVIYRGEASGDPHDLVTVATDGDVSWIPVGESVVDLDAIPEPLGYEDLADLPVPRADSA